MVNTQMSTSPPRALRTVRISAIATVILLVVGMGFETESSMPNAAPVFVDPQTNRFVSPPCLQLTEQQQRAFAEGVSGARTSQDSVQNFS